MFNKDYSLSADDDDNVQQDNTWVAVAEESVGEDGEDGDEVNIWEQKMALDAMHHDGAGQNLSYEEDVDAEDRDSDGVDWAAKTAARYARTHTHDPHNGHHDSYGHGGNRRHARRGAARNDNVEKEYDAHHLSRRLSEEVEEGEEKEAAAVGGERQDSGGGKEAGGMVRGGGGGGGGGSMVDVQGQHAHADQDRDRVQAQVSVSVQEMDHSQRVEYVHHRGGNEVDGSLSHEASADVPSMHAHIDALLGAGGSEYAAASREVVNMRPTTRGRDWQDAARPGTRGGRPSDTAAASRPGTRRGGGSDHVELARPTTSAGDARPSTSAGDKGRERDRGVSPPRRLPYAGDGERQFVGRAGSGRPRGDDVIPARPETRGRPGMSAKSAHAQQQQHTIGEGDVQEEELESGSMRGESARHVRRSSAVSKHDSSDEMDAALGDGGGEGAGGGNGRVDFLNLDDDDEEEEEEAD
jgi:hypothetical protein